MTASLFPDPDTVLRPPLSVEWTEQHALAEKPPPEPVPIPLGWRIVGWLCQLLFSLGGG